jgi:hypothetical protein
MPNKPHLRIGELLQCSEILEPTELEIAVDMHRAMPELPFGQFLVKQGFLTDSELYSALLGQRLIIDGKITVAQFQTAMYMLRESSIPLSETLVSRGWVSRQELESVTIPDPLAGAFAGPRLTRQVQEVPVSARPKDAGKINASNAVPSWAGQIDWADSAQSEAPPAPEIVPSEPEPAPEQAKLAQPEQAATPTPDKQAPPPPMRQAADVGRDPIVRALQEQLAAIHLGETPRKEEASPESWPKVEALEPEPGSPEGKENDSSRPAGPPAELEPHLEQIEEEPGGPATS